jgi:hypothetical protein
MTRKKFLLFIILYWSGVVYGQSSSLNLAMPNAPSSYQSDRIRTGDVECQMAIGSPTNVEFGVVGVINQNDPYSNNFDQTIDPSMYDSNDMIRDVGVYARITIPIGAPKQRLDCAKLYLIELEKQRLELFKLKQEISQLKALQFEN